MGADAAIAVVSASSLAVGVIVTSLTTGMTTDVDSYMFGSILAMTQADVVLSALLCVGVLVLSVLGFCVGLTGSYLLSTPVGASVVVVDLLIFLLCCGVRRVRG